MEPVAQASQHPRLTNGSNFAIFCPDASVFVGVCLNAQAAACVDDSGLEGGNVALYAGVELAQVEDGVGNQLARTMKGDEAATVGAVKLSTQLLQSLLLCLLRKGLVFPRHSTLMRKGLVFPHHSTLMQSRSSACYNCVQLAVFTGAFL